MLKKINITPKEQIFIVCILLAAVTLAVYWQVRHFDFAFDDVAYVTENDHLRSGITPEGVRWAFTTTYLGLWHPLIWLSLMLDHQLYGLHPGAYHMTNLILHILTTLLLFSLFHRMTGALWKSAFVAAFFALHPLHVESVAWIAERKDVLSAFFWMLTLYLYASYAENPSVKKYLPVLLAFVCALMSKPMVVTLPVVMMLLDYWPLKRFESNKNPWLWQLKEKWPLFVLSAVMIMIIFYTPGEKEALLKTFPLSSRLANAPVAFMAYLGKTFWPHDLAVLYPFNAYIPEWQIFGAALIIIVISLLIILKIRRLPFLFVGWFWFTIAIVPVLGIIQISLSTPYAMADRYHYLPSIGIAVMIAWGSSLMLARNNSPKKILFSTGIIFIILMSILTWKQCGYWFNTATVFGHALKVTKNNYVAHNNLGLTLYKAGKINEAIFHYNKAIVIKPDYAIAYNNRGNVYSELKRYSNALDDLNEAIRLRPDLADAYNNRGSVYFRMQDYKKSIKDFNEAIRLKQDFVDAYNNRGSIYFKLGLYQLAINDYNKAIHLNR
nr:tetratricopeptide repeat protein [Smithella sp.]